jgi:hypothetical protein
VTIGGDIIGLALANLGKAELGIEPAGRDIAFVDL